MASRKVYLEVRGRRFGLPPGESTVGRSRSCTVTLTDRSVSRTHALVAVYADRVTLQDLNSSNGTFVNGHQLRGETDLLDGDKVLLGKTEMRVAWVQEEAEGPASEAGGEAGAVRVEQAASPLTRSEAVSAGEALAVGEVLAASESGSWEMTAAGFGAAGSAAEAAPGDGEELTGESVAEPASGVGSPDEPAPGVPESPAAPAGPESPDGSAPQPADPSATGAAGGPQSAEGPSAAGELEEPVPPRGPAPSREPAPVDPGASSGGDRRSPASPGAVQPAPAPVASAAAAGTEILPSIEAYDRTLAPVPGQQEERARTVQSAAGFWPRLGAVLFDALWMGLLGLTAAFLAGGPWDLEGQTAGAATFLALWVSVSLFGWSVYGTTPGKRLLGLYVCQEDGLVGLSPGRALLRLFGYLAGILTLGAGFLMVGLSAGRRGLHDRMAGSYVVRRY